MLIRDKIYKYLIDHPGACGAEIALDLDMTKGQVAGHLNHLFEQELIDRGKAGDDHKVPWRYMVNGNEDTRFGEVTYIGNHYFRLYLEDDSAEFADQICKVLRRVVPDLKFARAYTEMVKLPVKRNKVIKIKGNNNA